MGNRLYTTAVVVFWLAAMGWLLTNRILPPFFGGEAPQTSLAYQVRPVAWRIKLDDIPCGTAVLQATEAAGGVREVHSVLNLTRMPAPENGPLWLRPMLASLKNLSLKMRTTTTFDSLGSLASFQTKMYLSKLDTPIQLIGRVKNDVMKVQVRAAGITHRLEKEWSSKAALAGELTPASRLLPLWDGRRWTQEVYSPFSSPNSPLEMLEAVVTGQIRMDHGDSSADVWVVEYRSVEKTGSTDEGRLRSRIYVNESGWILKQESFLFGSSVLLYRESEERSAELAAELLDLPLNEGGSPRDRAESSELGPSELGNPEPPEEPVTL